MIDWKRRDTALVAAAALLPMLTAVLSLTFPEPLWGVSPTVAVWTLWAVVGLGLASYKTWLLAGDQWALRILQRGFREWLGGLWSLSNAASLLAVCLLWTTVGIMAMLHLPWANAITAVLMMPHGVVLGTIVFGILVRRKLVE